MMSLFVGLLVILALSLLRKISRVLYVLSTGMNHENHIPKNPMAEKIPYENYSNCNHSNCNHHKNHLLYSDKAIHAEEMAIDKITKNNKRKLINVSLMVIKISPNSTPDAYHLSNSRPCAICVLKIKNMVYIGYKISKVYFSNKNGEIVCYKLQNLIKEKQYLSKYYRLSKNICKYMRDAYITIFLRGFSMRSIENFA